MKKKANLLLITTLIALSVFAQSSSLKYQAVIRDNNGQVIKNENVLIRVNILQGSETSASVYSEEHTITTNATGIVSFNIGEGNVVSGNYIDINWAGFDHFLKIELNRNNSGYVEMGTVPFLSVPYAIHAQTVADKNDADADPTNEIQDLNLSGNILTITDNTSASEIDLSKYENTNTDNQQLSLIGTQLSIDNGNSVDLSLVQDGTQDADANPSNEIQKISISNDTIFLTDGGLVKLPASNTGFSGSYNDLTDIPVNIDTDVTDDFSGAYSDLTGTPNLSTVATTGNYNDLSNPPDLSSFDNNVSDDFSGAYSDLTGTPNLSAVATSGNYTDLLNTPDLSSFDSNVSDDFSGSYADLTNLPLHIDTDSTNDFSGAYSDLTGAPNLSTIATSGNFNDLNNLPANLDTDSTDDFSGNYNDLAGAPTLANVATSGSFSDLSNVPANLDTDSTDDFSGNYSDLVGTPTLANVATSGSFSDLSNVPANLDTDSTDDFSGNYSDLVGKPTLSTVATSGNYSDLSNQPTLSGDATGSLNSVVVEKIQGQNFSAGTPSTGQVLKWSGTAWAPGSDATTGGSGVDGVVESISVTGTTTKTISLGLSADAASSSLTADFTDNVDDADANPSNEIQDLSISGNILTITNNGAATEIDLSTYLDDTNTQLTEAEVDSYVSNNGYLTSFTEIDGSISNEIQTLAIVGDTISLSKGGGKVTLPTKGWGGLSEESLFAVVNKKGDTVFAVYEGGVRIFVDTVSTKAARGGFAVATRSAAKGVTNDILNVNNDSVRIYLEESIGKAARGGFAVATRSAAKGNVIGDILSVSDDSVRIYLEETTGKAARGGFAVATRSAAKGTVGDILSISDDSVRIYLEEDTGKAARGGFAVATRSAAKGSISNVMKVTEDSTRIYVGNANAGFGVTNTDSSKNQKLMTLNELNNFIGQNSGINATTGKYNTFYGYSAGISTTKGFRNVFMGNKAGYSNTEGSDNIFLGNKAGYNNIGEGYEEVIINKVLFQGGTRNIFIGNESGYENTEGINNIFIGNKAGFSNNPLTDFATNQSGSYNVYIGDNAAYSNITGSLNLMMGDQTGYHSIGSHNVFLGAKAGYANSKSQNVFIGNWAGENSLGTASTFIGYMAGKASTGNTTLTYYNTYIGQQAGYGNSSGSYNVFVGAQAGRNNNGYSNVFIGQKSGYSESGNNKLYIENTSSSTPLIYGEFDNDLLQFNGNVGIKTTASSTRELSIGGEINLNAGIASGQAIMVNGKEALYYTSNYFRWGNGAGANYFPDKVGIATSQPVVNLHVASGSDAGLPAGSGYLLLGVESSTNICIDNNEIQCRTNGSSATLHLNYDGGDVSINRIIQAGSKSGKLVEKKFIYGVNAIMKIEPAFIENDSSKENVIPVLISDNLQKIIPEAVVTLEDDNKGIDYNAVTTVVVNAMKEQQLIIENQQKELNDVKQELELLKQMILEMKK